MPKQKRIVSCHPEKKYYALGLCRNCYEHQLRELNPAFLERQTKNKQEWWKKNLHKRAIYNRQRNNKARVERGRGWYLKFHYGISIAEYDALLVAQGGTCAICKRPPKKRRLSVDHNHKTKEVRGLLCFQCNYALGFFKDDLARLEAAATYIRNAQVKAQPKCGLPAVFGALIERGIADLDPEC